MLSQAIKNSLTGLSYNGFMSGNVSYYNTELCKQFICLRYMLQTKPVPIKIVIHYFRVRLLMFRYV